VYLWENTAAVEHCYCTEGISRSDDVRESGPFQLGDANAINELKACLERIARQPTF
jgi:hypothetical protein